MKVDNSVVWKWNPAAVQWKQISLSVTVFSIYIALFSISLHLLFLPSSFAVLTNQNETKCALIAFATSSKKSQWFSYHMKGTCSIFLKTII